MSYYLCIDCGGSKTIVVIADAAGNTLARTRGGPSNFAYLGLHAFLAVVRTTVENALASMHAALPDLPTTLPPPSDSPLFAAAWLGVSGVDSPAAIAALTPPLSALLGVRPRVMNDTSLLAAPLQLFDDVSSAVGCVGGTGGIVVSYREAGARGAEMLELGRVGGWGWVLGDEGGGFHVGREAIRQLLAEADRASVHAPLAPAPAPQTNGDLKGKPKGLKGRILARFGVHDVFELLTVVHLPDPLPAPAPALSAAPIPHPTPLQEEGEQPADGAVKEADVHTPSERLPREKRLSALAPLVFAAAFEDGDALALRVLRIAAGSLVDQICVLLRPEEEGGAAYAPHAQTGDAGWMATGWMGVGSPAVGAWAAAPGERTVRASQSVLCLGGSLVGLESYRGLVLEELKRRGHVFRRVQVVEDAAEVGAQALVKGGRRAAEV